MKMKFIIPSIALLLIILSCANGTEEKQSETQINDSSSVVLADTTTLSNEPWRTNQLIEPAALAKIINDPNSLKPIIYSVGPGGDIPGSIEMGAAQEKENLDKLKDALSKLDRDADIVVYCGCCPFEDCPNIRPSFELMNEMKFTNHKLLNLSHNIKVDWIDKGFPMEK